MSYTRLMFSCRRGTKSLPRVATLDSPRVVGSYHAPDGWPRTISEGCPEGQKSNPEVGGGNEVRKMFSALVVMGFLVAFVMLGIAETRPGIRTEAAPTLGVFDEGITLVADQQAMIGYLFHDPATIRDNDIGTAVYNDYTALPAVVAKSVYREDHPRSHRLAHLKFPLLDPSA